MKPMSSLTTRILLALTMTIPVPATSFAGYDRGDAEDDCKYKIRSTHQYDSFSGVNVEDKGHHSFKVTGQVRSDNNNKKHNFNCQIRHREITSWNVSSHSVDKDNKNAAIVGAGIIGLAAIAAIASNHNKDDDHDEQRDHYYSGSDENPFDDMSYLKKQCRHEIRSHLNQDHGRVDKLKFEHVQLNHRNLKGDGWVTFKGSQGRDLTFTCEFDRNGRIHDGYYKYIAAYNDEFEMDNDSSNYDGVPELVTRSSGEMEVLMPGGCTILYNKRGKHMSSGRSCSNQDRRDAKQAVKSYMREQGM